MISPLIRLFIREPELLADHLDAYIELAREDLRWLRRAIRQRMVLLVLGSGSVLVGSILVGVAALFWANSHDVYWMLLVIPLLPFVVALGCAIGLSRQGRNSEPLDRIWQQVEADLKVLRRIDDASATESGGPSSTRQTDGGDASRSEPGADTSRDEASGTEHPQR